MRKPIQQSLILALGMLFPTVGSAAMLSQEDALNVAAEFFQYGDVGRLAHKDAFSLAYVATDDSSTPVCYVFNAKDGKGFVIVSADSEAMPVIGYSTSSVWTVNAVPGAAQEMVSSRVLPVGSVAQARRVARAPREGGRLLSTPSWSQEAPFNNNIPNRRLTGCVGVALAEILKYHSWPQSRPASLVKEGESSLYDWASMRSDNYRGGYEAAEADAVATLVADAAIAIGTDFGMSSSSAFEVKVPYALTSMFGYDAGVSYKKRAELGKEEWDRLIVDEIEEGRPVLYSGQDVSSGHAFVCDGYEMRGDTPFFHINWGWGGSADGYYASDALNPVVSRAHSYNNLMTVVYNIKPASDSTVWSPLRVTSDERQPGLTLDTPDISSAASFTVRAGAIKNISNSDFSGKLAVALFGSDGRMKGLLSDARNYKLVALQIQKYADFSCKLPAGVSVAADDVVRLASQSADGEAWLPVSGDLLAPGEAAAKGGAIPYFAVNVPSGVADVQVTAGEGRVIKGRDYAFKVVSLSPDKVVTVRANGFILSPDASDNYRLTNVVEDQEIDILVQDAADVLSKSVLWVEAGNLQNLLDDKETATVTDLTLFGSINANDFAFIRDRMKLERLDISQTSITAVGANPANAIPAKAFSGYRSLKSILLPSGVTLFKNGCFHNTGLTSIDIPASVATWEYNVFNSCRSLQEVIVRRANPAWINWCVFEGTPRTRLVVPEGAASAYKSKEYWRDFKDIVEDNPAAAESFKVSVQERKGLRFTPLTEGTEFESGASYSFSLDTDDSFGDATMEVYANSTRLYPATDGTYTLSVRGNTLVHVEFKNPQATTVDKNWFITGEAGGVGLVSEVVNVPVGKSFSVRVNALKIPSGADSGKFYAVVLTDSKGAVKEFVSPVYTNTSMTTGAQSMNLSCMVKEASVKDGNQLRIATSYDKKNWSLVEADAEGISDRLDALGNPVVYHSVTMPSSISGAKIEGQASQVVRGMPFSLRVTPINPAQRVTLAVNGVNKAVNAAIANLSIPAVTEDLDITIQINDADASDYVVVNVKEGELAAKIAECPERLKVIGTIQPWEFDAFRAHAGNIIDLDLADLTIKGTAMTRNAIPENAFAPKQAGGASALRSVVLPGSLERIDQNAFARCLQLAEIEIPATVTYIGSGAFSTCAGLKKIVSNATVPPALGAMTPFPANPSSITLVVPKGFEWDYGQVSFWNTLNIYKETEPTETYWIKYDRSRIMPYYLAHDVNSVQVGSKTVEIWLSLPNYQRPNLLNKSLNSHIRTGVAFKLFDNGNDVFESRDKNYSKSPYNYDGFNPSPDYTQDGGRIKLYWMPGNEVDARMPQNHELDVVFYYPVTWELLDGAAGTRAQYVGLLDGQEWKDVSMSKFIYGDYTKKTLYRENDDLTFRLTPASKNVVLSVHLIQRVMTQSGLSPVYETREFDLLPNADGLYTIPALPGDTRVQLTGYLHVEEGDPIPASDLAAVLKEEVEGFSEVIVTGEMDEDSFDLVREKFESVETLDLSGIDNEAIPEGAFEGMESLRNVVLPEGVSEIGAGAFRDCGNLESVTLPGVTGIGEGAFEGCSSLTSLIIPAAGSDSGEMRAPRRRLVSVSRSVEGEEVAEIEEVEEDAPALGISVESFRGLSPNCLIYLGSHDIADAEALNIILNVDGHRVAASDIVLDGAHPFNAPASFSLGDHRISFSVDMPGSLGADTDDAWKGLMLPFTPTGMTYGVEFANREGSGLHLLSFDGEDAAAMTPQTHIEANRPYMAHVVGPFASVPVTFYADGLSSEEEFVYDVKFTPVPEENVAVGRDFSLYGSYDGESRLGLIYALSENGDSFARPIAGEEIPVGAYSAYLCANHEAASSSLAIGEHPVWVFEPVTAAQVYRGDKVELKSATSGAAIYYTLDGSDPADPEGARVLYAAPFEMEGEAMSIKAYAEYKDYHSDVVSLEVALRRSVASYSLPAQWSWISHNMESPVAVADFFASGVDRVLSQDEETIRDPRYGFVGDLKELAPSVAYKVFVGAEGWTGDAEGVAVNPSVPVSLRKGCNWIGAPADDASMAVTHLFSGVELEEGDMVVGLEGYAQVDADGRWVGSLASLRTGLGYLFFSNSDKQLVYAFVDDVDEEGVAPAALAPSKAPWAVDIHRYPSVMPVTAEIVGASGKDASDYAVGAFCGDECRGVGVEVDGVVMLNVHGQAGDDITFRFVSAGGEQLRASESLPFAEVPVCTIAHPYELRLSGATVIETPVADGYEVVSENGSILIGGDLSDVVCAEVYDVAGNRVAVAVPDAEGRILIESLEKGMRLVVVRTSDSCFYHKLLVK